jgi:rSAM/selenodomain-associated transferase 2/rSAM/selenodomain-associated transferase 1
MDAIESQRCAPAAPRTEFGDRLILFSRYPWPGRTKTRLIPRLGAEGAAALQRAMTAHTVRTAHGVAAQSGARVEVRYDGATPSSMRQWLGKGLCFRAQGEGDLGQRIERALRDAFAGGGRRVVVIGCDSPELDTPLLNGAFRALEQTDLVIGPARDGGYYLIGLRKPVAQLWRDIDWGSERVLAQTLKVVEQIGLGHRLLPELEDVDRPEDLGVWERARQRASKLAVIIPTLNEAEMLRTTLPAVLAGQPDEVIVADGGSVDGSIEVARQLGVKVVQSSPGRGRQMNAGAKIATAAQLLFLHADTLPPPEYREVVGQTLARPDLAAGAFAFAIREQMRQRRTVERLVAARCRWLGNPFGDQGLFVRRDLFEALGGFVDWPLLEDVEIQRRLKRHGRLAITREAAATSGRRWQARGVWSTLWLNQRIMLGYYLGVSVERLARLYRAPGSGRPVHPRGGVVPRR